MSTNAKYRMRCSACNTETNIDDYCMIRDEAVKHLEQCTAFGLKEIKITTPDGGQITFKKQKPGEKKL
jgi:hypothetical protein